ncbi:MAG TPA: hypothetical protein VMF08_07805 [Candidatus Sulfotelmatobacter sp.]|nr:hypothetical protein [Candidatus Sulfotelmatobacter sp.]
MIRKNIIVMDGQMENVIGKPLGSFNRRFMTLPGSIRKDTNPAGNWRTNEEFTINGFSHVLKSLLDFTGIFRPDKH